MIELPEGFDSIFRFITVVSQRAEQLINGAKVRSDSRHKKSTLQAKDDVELGTVEWRILTQEELDAQRQAIVDQFRAEVGAEEYEGTPIPPGVVEAATAAATGGERPAGAPPDEQDDELARLQRLLGLTVEDPEDEEAASAEDEDTDVDTEESLDIEEEESFEQLDQATAEGYDDSDDEDEDE